MEAFLERLVLEYDELDKDIVDLSIYLENILPNKVFYELQLNAMLGYLRCLELRLDDLLNPQHTSISKIKKSSNLKEFKSGKYDISKEAYSTRKSSLLEKINKLTAFIKSDNFSKVTTTQSVALRIQLYLMQAYLDCMEEITLIKEIR